MPIRFRPFSLFAAGVLALAAGCAKPAPEPVKGIVLNPPAPPARLRRVVAARPRPAAQPAGLDETGLTRAQKEDLFGRFVESRGFAETRAAGAAP